MRTELVSIATDTTPLDGAYYTPPDVPARGGVLLLHGNGGNFYSGPCRFLVPQLVAAGWACLAFNRHGHETLTTRTRAPEGNAYQTAAQAISDNEAAAAYFAARGYPDPVIAGHSNGGMLATQFAADHPATPALVLLSAHCGGRDMLPRASSLGLLAGTRLAELTHQARQMVAQGRGGELMLLPGWWYVTSAVSFIDMTENLPSLLANAAAIRCPTLYFRGDEEDVELYPAEAFAEAATAPVDVRIIGNCGHFYLGHEDEVARQVVGWLGSTAGSGAAESA